MEPIRLPRFATAPQQQNFTCRTPFRKAGPLSSHPEAGRLATGNDEDETMTENTQRHAETDTGSGRNDGKRRARGWIMAVMLLGLGAAGGALTTVALDAGAHGGWGGGHRMFRHGHATDPAQAIERVQHASAWALGSVDATDEQREQVDAILAGAVNDLFPLRAEHRAGRRDLIAELSRPEIDRSRLEQIRTEQLALADKATARLLDATVAVSEVLDPEQRQQLVAKLAKRRR